VCLFAAPAVPRVESQGHGAVDRAPVNFPSGVLSIPTRLTNNSGQAVTRLRVRIVALSTFPSPLDNWDLRAIDGTGTVTNSAGTVVVSGLQPMTLELPVQQFNGWRRQ
jgi:hypothetical protein